MCTYDGSHDVLGCQEKQLRVIEKLCPISSLVKFKVPRDQEFYDYAPGKILKKVFLHYACYWEFCLVIDGAPKDNIRYNCYELHAKLLNHQRYLRGQVYESACPRHTMACL